MKNTGNMALLVCVALIAYLIIDKVKSASANKIGVVQMDKLVYDFKGMKEATAKYSDKMKQWSGKSDSLENCLKEMYNQIRLDSLNKNQGKLDGDIRAFTVFKRSYMEYLQNMEENAAKQDKEMTLGVINQLNEYIKEYAKNEGYDVILCNTQQQSVGYAKDAIDVTNGVLEFANNKYDGN